MRTFVRVRDAAKALDTTEKAIYEQIRTGIFPFRFRRAGRSIWISAHDLELIPPATDPQKREEQPQVESLTAAA
jgi:hypothetical protein